MVITPFLISTNLRGISHDPYAVPYSKGNEIEKVWSPASKYSQTGGFASTLQHRAPYAHQR